MRLLALVVVLTMVALTAGAARPCNNGGVVWGLLNSRGLAYAAFPVPVPTPGGHMATGYYFDDRAQGTISGPNPFGFIAGDGTWLYLETNGVAGLQRGGVADVPSIPFTHDEYAACANANPDELVVGIE